MSNKKSENFHIGILDYSERTLFNQNPDSTGYKIYTRRNNLEMSREILCEKTGLNKNTLARYEKGITYPEMETLEKIADALDIDRIDLMDGYYAFKRNFVKNIKWLREKMRLSQKALGELVGIKNSGTVSEWEKGLHVPKGKVLLELWQLYDEFK